MGKAKTQKYIVTRKGVTVEPGGKSLEVGAEITLTDKQAQGRVNKVVLKSSIAAATSGVNPLENVVKELEAERDELIEQLDERAGEVSQLVVERDELVTERDVAVKATLAVTKERDELVKSQVDGKKK